MRIDELRVFSEGEEMPPRLVDVRDVALRRLLKVHLYCTLVTACFAGRRVEMPNFEVTELAKLRRRVEALAKDLRFTIDDRHTLPEMLGEPLGELLGEP